MVPAGEKSLLGGLLSPPGACFAREIACLARPPAIVWPMVVESSGRVHATLRVGGRPVLVWSVVELHWMGLGKATLIHAPAAAHKLLQQPFPTATAVSNACQLVFGEDAAVLHSLEVQVRDLDPSLLGGAVTKHWRRGVE